MNSAMKFRSVISQSHVHAKTFIQVRAMTKAWGLR